MSDPTTPPPFAVGFYPDAPPPATAYPVAPPAPTGRFVVVLPGSGRELEIVDGAPATVLGRRQPDQPEFDGRRDVSGAHVWISRQGGDFVVEDPGSLNGTRVPGLVGGGGPLPPGVKIRVPPGMTVVLGTTEVRVERRDG